jgi:hypothetical protein
VGSEILLYSERCIVQKLLAGELPWASIGFHDLRCPSNTQFYAFLEASRAFQTGLVEPMHCHKLHEGVRLLKKELNWSFVSLDRFYC